VRKILICFFFLSSFLSSSFFLFLLLTVLDSDNFKKNEKFQNQYFLGHSAYSNYLSVFCFPVLLYFQFSCCTIGNVLHCSWLGCSRSRGGQRAGWNRKSFCNCCFEFHSVLFCVQILVPPSGLKDGSNNIRPLRNQFQMLLVTNRSWKFGVVGRESIEGLSYRKEPYFLPDLYSFRVLRHFRITHWSCTAIQNITKNYNVV